MAQKKETRSKRPAKPVQGEEDKISISETGSNSAIAAGRGARAIVVNLFGGWIAFWAIIALVVIAVVGYFGWQYLNPEKMTGSFRVAVAGFETNGNSDSTDIGDELSFSIYKSIDVSLADIKEKYDIHIWGPDQVGQVTGNTAEERSQSAQKIAETIDANIIIYGYIDATSPTWKIYPEFYIASTNSIEVEEVTGQYDFGHPVELASQENETRRFELNDKFSARSQAISRITIGLLYFSIRDYEKALDAYKLAETIEGWDDDQGKAVLYLLMGNAAGKGNHLDVALEYLEHSLQIDPEYARPYITIAGVYYLQALKPFESSQRRQDINQELLEKSILTFNQALSAAHKPEWSDIETKVHFGLGQSYLMQAYGGASVDPNLAAKEFQQVIDEYGGGKNPRVRELAAEAHARLGLLYAFSGNLVNASGEYQLAADLLFDNPERRQQYQETANKYSGDVTATP